MPCSHTKEYRAMQKEYGAKKGKQVYYATKNKDKGFYTHMTHASLQSQEDSVPTSGDGFDDAAFPKSPKTDCFEYRNKEIF
jgi:hypothetical protein